MFYKIIRPIARFIVWVLNGHLHVHHKDRIPKGNYILVALIELGGNQFFLPWLQVQWNLCLWQKRTF